MTRVYERKDGRWVIATTAPDGVVYLSAPFETEAEALAALG